MTNDRYEDEAVPADAPIVDDGADPFDPDTQGSDDLPFPGDSQDNDGEVEPDADGDEEEAEDDPDSADDAPDPAKADG